MNQPNTPKWVIACPIEVDNVLIGMITCVSFDEAKEFSQCHSEIMERASLLIAYLFKMRSFFIADDGDTDVDKRLIKLLDKVRDLSSEKKSKMINVIESALELSIGH